MSGNSSRQDFISGFREGIYGTVREVYYQQYATLYSSVHQVIQDSAVTGSIVTDTFIKLLHRRSFFDNPESINTFLYRTARTACLHYIQQAGAQNRGDEQPVIKEKQGKSVIDDTFTKETVHRLLAITAQLPATTQKIYELVYKTNAPVATIAAELGISPETVVQQKAGILKYLLKETGNDRQLSPLHLIYFLAIEWPAIATTHPNPLR